ncbi:hypothetical protein H257_00936 [Aphanomyces astaci]|uniref:Uncharacterized protein n=1 Tax=Aphanomyces astaci TaxID=112090 RepID=W4H5M4_APHAT|nr:hypothetical protein H257_00936 [Aphanomyces astaci]ETV87315.1 hypothetical protein H257_00936 [Aphanomyces astaci]|eukprot:XP_009822178.1 hypothetical protein H257_00936 [Aphanomyces astaci]
MPPPALSAPFQCAASLPALLRPFCVSPRPFVAGCLPFVVLKTTVSLVGQFDGSGLGRQLRSLGVAYRAMTTVAAGAAAATVAGDLGGSWHRRAVEAAEGRAAGGDDCHILFDGNPVAERVGVMGRSSQGAAFAGIVVLGTPPVEGVGGTVVVLEVVARTGAVEHTVAARCTALEGVLYCTQHTGAPDRGRSSGLAGAGLLS